MSGLNTQHIKLTRRKLISLGAISLASGTLFFKLLNKYKNQRIPRLSIDENSKRGHLVRSDFNPTVVTSVKKIDIVIIGSGISGLSTAYFLEKQNQKNYLILEADQRIGGNSASSKNEISAYPLGAHYLPIVRNDDQELNDFLYEHGVITGYKNNLPLYKEEYLCSAPQERLLIKGRWQESLVPQYGASQEEISEIKEFLDFVERLRSEKGSDQRFVFSIPVDKSSQDPKWLALDQISFREYLDSKNWKSEYLNWYVNYCCRDDFGLEASETSAWAGLHYFASRSGLSANAEPQAVVTWPEGNGFLVERLNSKLSQKVSISSTVRQVIKNGDGFKVFYSDSEFKTHLIECKKIVYAIPKFVVKKIQPELFFSTMAQNQPWLLANIKINKEALEEKGNLCWDNVRFKSDSLGYINSSQQVLTQDSEFVNISFYHAYSKNTSILPKTSEPAAETRRTLSMKTDVQLYDFVLQELKKMHASIEGTIEKIEFKIIGHGMVAPIPGYIWGRRLQIIKEEPLNIIFAHTERAGISIFEEGFHQGLRAAKLLKGFQ